MGFTIDTDTKERILTEAGIPLEWNPSLDERVTIDESDYAMAMTILRAAGGNGALIILALAHTMADSRFIIDSLVNRIAELERDK